MRSSSLSSLLPLLVASLLSMAMAEGAAVLASTRYPTAAPTASFPPTAVPSTSPTVLLDTLQGVNVFRYTGLDVHFVVPPGITELRVYMWGAGGSIGGNGAYVEGTLDVAPGVVLTAMVGQAGCYYCQNVYGGGGIGVLNAGGGRSAIRLGDEDLVTAGGGGAGYYTYGGSASAFKDGSIQSTSYRGDNYEMSSAASDFCGGGGGNTTGGQGALYCTEVGSNGTLHEGGSTSICYCGGGGGYFGGGAGHNNCGGGAGSSYLYNLRDYDASDEASLQRYFCAGQYSKYFYDANNYNGDCGQTNRNGFIVIEVPQYLDSTTPTAAPSVSFEPTVAPTANPTRVPTGALTATPTAILNELQYINMFSYTGYPVSFVVPSDVTELRVYMWGAGGSGNGGVGAYVEGTLDVTPDQMLSVVVGQGGCQQCQHVFGGGGSGLYYSGGGRSAIRLDDEDLVTAGGGGAGCNSYGGSASALKGGVIQSTSYRGSNDAMITNATYYNGGGGSVSKGGRGGLSCSNLKMHGSKYEGGSSSCHCAGGGGGYNGGGAGYYAGGGGSSYLANLRDYGASDEASLQYYTCAGQYSKYYYDAYSSCGSFYQNGFVVIEVPQYEQYYSSAATINPSLIAVFSVLVGSIAHLVM